tara:strand:- start:110 stop:565 length:456 start_codon:yes stop_codon:yes gene_type:complete
MITIEKILFLRNVPLFSGMLPRELSHLAGIAQEVVYTSGEQIIKQGEHGTSMFLIVEGSVRIHTDALALAVLGEKDYFGEMSILDGEPRSASATADTDCLLLRIDQDNFQTILSNHFEVALTIIRTLTQRLRQVEQTKNADSPSEENTPNA